MFLASILGSKYSSLFYCRLRDNGENPDLILNETQQLFSENNVKTEIIAGSIRTQEDALNALINGANIVTTSFNTIVNMTKHPKTDESIDGFLKDLKLDELNKKIFVFDLDKTLCNTPEDKMERLFTKKALR